jgi:hypothetical protein
MIIEDRKPSFPFPYLPTYLPKIIVTVKKCAKTVHTEQSKHCIMANGCLFEIQKLFLIWRMCFHH